MKKQILLIACFVVVFSVNAQSVSQDYSVLKNANLLNNHTVDGKKSIFKAIKTAGFVKTLESEGPFTLFVPTEAAITNLPDEYRFKSLLQPENKKQLKGIVSYHLLKGEFRSDDIVKLIKENDGEATIKAVNGNELKLSLSYGKVKIKDEQGNTATVEKSDINSSNGVVHVIDKVLIP